MLASIFLLYGPPPSLLLCKKGYQKKMKIFNWVHRRFSNKEENAGKKNGSSASVVDDDHHLDQLWSGGILSIGTFGYDRDHDPLLILSKQGDHEEAYYDSDYDGDDQMTIDHNTIDTDDDEEKEEEEYVVETHEIEVEGEEEEAHDLKVNYRYNSKREFEYVMMEKTERITLADLFSADHHQEKVPITVNDNNDDNANKNHSKLAAAANGKKHAGSKMTEEAPSIHKKLQHMMRRMMKRKIHPDLVVTSPPLALVLDSKVMEANDDALLLPTQGSS